MTKRQIALTMWIAALIMNLLVISPTVWIVKSEYTEYKNSMNLFSEKLDDLQKEKQNKEDFQYSREALTKRLFILEDRLLGCNPKPIEEEE